MENFPRISPKRKRSSGQSAVEFAIVIPLFMMLVVAVVDVSRFVFIEASMSHIVRTSLRYGVTGLYRDNPNENPNNANDDFLNWADSLIAVAKDNNPVPAWIQINKTADSFLIYLDENPSSTFPEDFPRGEKVTIQFTQEFDSLMPFAEFLIGGPDGMDIVVKTTYQMEK